MTEHECICQMQAVVEELRRLNDRLANIDGRIERAVAKGARKARDRDRLVAVAVQGGRR